mgnify:CR=1 FL=1
MSFEVLDGDVIINIGQNEFRCQKAVVWINRIPSAGGLINQVAIYADQLSNPGEAADTVSRYLIERAEQYQPVVEMPTGIEVEIVFLDGVHVRSPSK